MTRATGPNVRRMSSTGWLPDIASNDEPGRSNGLSTPPNSAGVSSSAMMAMATPALASARVSGRYRRSGSLRAASRRASPGWRLSA